MKKNVKALIVISLGLIFGIFTNTYYCSAQTLETTTSIPVTGKVIFNENINNNIPNKDDVQGNVPIKPPFNPDKNLIDVPKTGDTADSIYWIIIVLAILVLILKYKTANDFEKEELANEKKKNNSNN
ncbi:hypothetical protein GNF80_17650 [Clostridium perfringens]|nr:hypothetical protein [Clostridium perfringens]